MKLQSVFRTNLCLLFMFPNTHTNISKVINPKLLQASSEFLFYISWYKKKEVSWIGLILSRNLSTRVKTLDLFLVFVFFKFESSS
jgi:hypothetical protein